MRVDPLSHPSARGLAGVWLGRDGAGSLVADRGLYGAHGVRSGSRWGASDDGWSIELEGTGSSNDRVVIPSEIQPGLLMRTGVTLSFWVWSDTTQENKGLWGDWESSDFSWLIRLRPTTPLFEFDVRVGGTQPAVLKPATPIQLGKWTHLAGTWGLGCDDAKPRLLVDGELFISATSNIGPLTGAPNDIEIGRHAESNDRAHAGRWRDCLLWNRGMSTSEFKSLYTLKPEQLLSRGAY